MNNRNITYTSKIRRVIVLLFPTSQILAESLLKISFITQKIGNFIKFEKFWKTNISRNKEVTIVERLHKNKRAKKDIWDIAIKKVLGLGKTGVIYEFGTNNGGSLLYFRDNLPNEIKLHGFDCFEGLPEGWDGLGKGAMKGDGYPYHLWRDHPEQRKEVESHLKLTGEILAPPTINTFIHKGLFAHTFYKLLRNGIESNIRLIHFDADLYSSTRGLLDSICGQIKYKYYILFDEFNSVNHEFLSWIEFTNIYNVEKWKVIAASRDGAQVLLEIN